MITDLVEFHLGWMSPRSDLTVVPTEGARREVLAAGVPEERVQLLGLPVDLRFRPPAPGEKAALRRRFGLDQKRFTILVSGGGEGSGKLLTQVRALAGRQSGDWQLIVVCGRNEKLQRRLSRVHFRIPARVLGFVDRDCEVAPLDTVLAEQATEQDEVKRYYARAGDNSARIVYFKGMLLGTAALAAFIGFAFVLSWGLGWLDPGDEATYTLFVVIAMGAAGAILSVMTRMAKENGFGVDFEVGRKSVRFLGGLRPWIGALFALALYLALKSSLIEFLKDASHTVYFYATIAFLLKYLKTHSTFLFIWYRILLGGVLWVLVITKMV